MTKWLLGLSLAAVAAAAGCGGGGSTLTKAEFIRRADAVCTAAHAKENAIQLPQVDPASASKAELATLGDAIAKATDVDRKEIDDLRRLEPPADFQRTFDGALDEFGEGLDHADRAADAARNGNVPVLRSQLRVLQSKANAANARARAYGLKVCGAG